jgi:hypothetical protein
MPEPPSALPRLLCAPVAILRTRPVIATLATAFVALVAPSPDGGWAGAGVLLVCALSYSCGAHARLWAKRLRRGDPCRRDAGERGVFGVPER